MGKKIRPEPMTPQKFAAEMRRIAIANEDDIEVRHQAADALMVDALKSLGYAAGVNVFQGMKRYYA